MGHAVWGAVSGGSWNSREILRKGERDESRELRLRTPFTRIGRLRKGSRAGETR